MQQECPKRTFGAAWNQGSMHDRFLTQQRMYAYQNRVPMGYQNPSLSNYSMAFPNQLSHGQPDVNFVDSYKSNSQANRVSKQRQFKFKKKTSLENEHRDSLQKTARKDQIIQISDTEEEQQSNRKSLSSSSKKRAYKNLQQLQNIKSMNIANSQKNKHLKLGNYLSNFNNNHLNPNSIGNQKKFQPTEHSGMYQMPHYQHYKGFENYNYQNLNQLQSDLTYGYQNVSHSRFGNPQKKLFKDSMTQKTNKFGSTNTNGHSGFENPHCSPFFDDKKDQKIAYANTHSEIEDYEKNNVYPRYGNQSQNITNYRFYKEEQQLKAMSQFDYFKKHTFMNPVIGSIDKSIESIQRKMKDEWVKMNKQKKSCLQDKQLIILDSEDQLKVDNQKNASKKELTGKHNPNHFQQKNKSNSTFDHRKIIQKNSDRKLEHLKYHKKTREYQREQQAKFRKQFLEQKQQFMQNVDRASKQQLKQLGQMALESSLDQMKHYRKSTDNFSSKTVNKVANALVGVGNSQLLSVQQLFSCQKQETKQSIVKPEKLPHETRVQSQQNKAIKTEEAVLDNRSNVAQNSFANLQKNTSVDSCSLNKGAMENKNTSMVDQAVKEAASLTKQIGAIDIQAQQKLRDEKLQKDIQKAELGRPYIQFTAKLKRLKDLSRKREEKAQIMVGAEFQVEIPRLILGNRDLKRFRYERRMSLLQRMHLGWH